MHQQCHDSRKKYNITPFWLNSFTCALQFFFLIIVIIPVFCYPLPPLFLHSYTSHTLWFQCALSLVDLANFAEPCIATTDSYNFMLYIYYAKCCSSSSQTRCLLLAVRESPRCTSPNGATRAKQRIEIVCDVFAYTPPLH